MVTVIAHLETRTENDALSIMNVLGKEVAFFDHPQLAYLKQEMLFSGTEVKPRQREVLATDYFLEIETNPALEKRISQALNQYPAPQKNKLDVYETLSQISHFTHRFIRPCKFSVCSG